MNGLITEGIPLGAPIQILTGGLGSGSPIPPPYTVMDNGFTFLNLNRPYLLFEGGASEQETGVYKLPTRTTSITWELSGTVTDVELHGSLDGVHFSAIDSADAVGDKTVKTNVTSFKIVIIDGSDVACTITPKGRGF